jgi:putative transposase
MPHVGELKYHIVWCTKYRRKVLDEKIQDRTKQLITETCKKNGYKLLEIEVMGDHVHCFIQGGGRDSVHRIVSQLKGATSSQLRKEFETLKTRLPNLWTRGYYAGSVGFVSDETVRRYIQNQKNV